MRRVLGSLMTRSVGAADGPRLAARAAKRCRGGACLLDDVTRRYLTELTGRVGLSPCLRSSSDPHRPKSLLTSCERALSAAHRWSRREGTPGWSAAGFRSRAGSCSPPNASRVSTVSAPTPEISSPTRGHHWQRFTSRPRRTVGATGSTSRVATPRRSAGTSQPTLGDCGSSSWDYEAPTARR